MLWKVQIFTEILNIFTLDIVKYLFTRDPEQSDIVGHVTGTDREVEGKGE